jgi:pyruvate/2-oxoglutarate dehydrogenase complex dihydrolipoamide acyltransferase (E2) component
MKENQDTYQVLPFPKVRQPMVDGLRQSRSMSIVHMLLEVDVTDARNRMREFGQRKGEPLSFTAFLTLCLARAVEENKLVHAYRRGSKLVVYDQIDVAVIVGREGADEKVPVFPHIIRAANQKTLPEIHDEIRKAQSQDSPLSRDVPRLRRYYYLPGFIRCLLWRRWLGSPIRHKRWLGTVGISALGMFGKGVGWGIPIPLYTLGISVGGITRKPGIVNGKIEPREYLSLTASFDHNVVDGAPAARFCQRLKELIESGHGLRD